jgi:serine/threonine protein kinase
MTSYAGGGTQVLRHSSGNPWGSFIHQRSLEDSGNPPKNVPTLQNALSAWKRMSGDHGLTLGIQDHVPLPQGHILGAGGGGIVFETRIDGIAMAWKRIITRSHTERERYINEIRILGHMTEQRHRHIINLIGSFTHRLRNHNYELSIITWPVARCDLSALMREVDSINDWKSRDETHSGRIRATQPTDEEKTAFENILKLENLEQDRSTLSTWHFREYSLNKTLQRLTRSIGCVAEAIKYLHDKGIRHKDIKPSQILVSSDGLWLTDFGWSKDISQLTTSETSGGDRITIRYHAPEREEWRPCGRAEDIFSLGCTFLEMGYRICGFRPKDYLKPTNSSPWSFQANLGSMHLWLAPFRLQETSLESFLSGVIERMMAYETRERPTIDEVTALLRLHSRRDRDSFFGPCCKPHESLGKSGNILSPQILYDVLTLYRSQRGFFHTGIWHQTATRRFLVTRTATSLRET